MTLEVLGLKLDNFQTDMLAMLVYGFVWRVLALATLYGGDGLAHSTARLWQAASSAHSSAVAAGQLWFRVGGQGRRGAEWTRVQQQGELVASSVELAPRMSRTGAPLPEDAMLLGPSVV